MRRVSRRSVLAAATAGLLALGAVLPQLAAALPVPAGPSVAWHPTPYGLVGPVSALLRDAPARGPVRVVALTDRAGRPHVTTVVAADRAAAARAVVRARQLPGVVSVSLDHAAGIPDAIVAVRARMSAAATASNDTMRTWQWALDKLHAEDSWALHDASSVTVGVVDTGVQADHPDLAGVVVPGKDFLNPAQDGRVDANGHGTHVAGIIAAVAGNRIGVAGLAKGAKILPVRVLDQNGSGWYSDIAAGLIFAVDAGVPIVNLSLGGDADDPTMRSAVAYAQSRNVLVVAAGGNFRASGNPVFYPAAYDGVLAVAATDTANRAGSFSETGSYIDVAAPGVSILSTYLPNAYAYMSGTSMASPYVAAAAALLHAADPSLGAVDLAARLTSTAADLGAPGRDDVFGAGLVDPLAALRATTAAAVPAAPAAGTTPTADPSGGGGTPGDPAADPSDSPSDSPSPTPTTPPVRRASVTSLGLSAAKVPAGSPVTVSISVRGPAGPAAAPPSGNVQVCRHTLAADTCRTLTLRGGSASWTVPVSAVAVFTATFPGSATLLPSRSTARTVQVLPGKASRAVR